MIREARYWRWCADGTDLVTGVAARRNTFPRLIAMMRADAARYREWADRLDRESREWPWAGVRLPSEPLPRGRWL